MEQSLHLSRRKRLNYKRSVKKSPKPLYLPFLAISSILGLGFLLTISASRIAYAGTTSFTPEIRGEFRSLINQYRLPGSDNNNVESDFGPVAVSVSYDGAVESHLVRPTKVEEILKTLEIEYESGDIVQPAPEAHVADNVNITIVRVENSTEIKNEAIPFETVYVDDPNANAGTKVVLQSGSEGVLTTTYSLRYEDGVLIDRVENETYISVQPVNEIISKGTKPVVTYPPEVTDPRCTDWKIRVDAVTSDEYERAWLKYVMWKESRCNESNDYNPIYKGLFQYHPNTYANAGGVNIFDGQEQLEITARTIRTPYRCRAWNYCPMGYK